jgi:hypothetical protein
VRLRAPIHLASTVPVARMPQYWATTAITWPALIILQGSASVSPARQSDVSRHRGPSLMPWMPRCMKPNVEGETGSPTSLPALCPIHCPFDRATGEYVTARRTLSKLPAPATSFMEIFNRWWSTEFSPNCDPIKFIGCVALRTMRRSVA